VLLNNALLALQDNPSLGHRSRQLPAQYRILHVGRHLIIYRFSEGMVYIIRILHDRMDIRQHLEETGESLDDNG
jgi:toxin ParE1/3/4